MAQKEFIPIHDRVQLLNLRIPCIEEVLLEHCYLIERRISEGLWLNPVRWTPGKVKSEIERITKKEPDHLIPGRKHDPGPHYKGLYIWSTSEGNVQYIGVSQNLETRIAHHVTQKNRSIATWAYIMSKHDAKGKDVRIKGSYDFIGREKIQKQILKSYRCTVVLESNDYLLYMLEAYAAVYFKSFWNLFHTH